MTQKLYLWRIKVRSQWLWSHASSSTEALKILSEQTGEPLEEYCLEWRKPCNLDGTEITPCELHDLTGAY